MPPLKPAAWPPTLRELPPPPLELFDLDDEWAGTAGRLAVLTNKCTDDDLEYYIRQAGELIGLCDLLDRQSREGADVGEGKKGFTSTDDVKPEEGGVFSTGRWSGKELIASALRQIIEYKKLEQGSDTEDADHTVYMSSRQEEVLDESSAYD